MKTYLTSQNQWTVRAPMVGLFVLASAVALVTPPIASARQPLPPRVTLGVSMKGSLPDITIQNAEQTAFRVVLNPGRLNTIDFEPVESYVGAGSSAYVTLQTKTPPDGPHILHINAQLIDPAGRSHAVPVSLLQMFQFAKGFGQTTTFEDAYLNTRKDLNLQSLKGNFAMGAGYTDETPAVQRTWAAIPTPQLPIPVAAPFGNVRDMLSLPLNSAPSSNAVSAGAIPFEAAAAVFPKEDLKAVEETLAEEPQPSTKNGRRATVPTILTGYLDIIDRPGRTLTGWGFTVTVWQHQPTTGHLVPVGFSDVNYSGWWSTVLTAPYLPGLPVFIQYWSANRFFSVVDATGTVYAWTDVVTIPGTYLNMGRRAADLSRTVPGLGEIVYGGGMFWSKFNEWRINPVGPRPYRITYPNTLATGHCPTGSGNPWSCSEGSGNIWLIMAHADRSVVQHELTHSVHRTFWTGHWPAGAGGDHDLRGCYNPGLALTEGFADFMPFAVQHPFDVSRPRVSYLDYDIEDPSDEEFCAGPTNEGWVSALLWDQYDYWNDGPSADRSDSTFMTARGGPTGLILSNPRNSIQEYLPLHLDGHPWPVQSQIYAEHRLNTIIP